MATLEEIARMDPAFRQAGNIEDIAMSVYDRMPVRRQVKRGKRQGSLLADLLAKSKGGFATAPAGQAIAWASLPPEVRAKLDPVMAESTGDRMQTGWAISDLTSRDVMMLRRLMGRQGWQKWLGAQRAQLQDPNWLPEVPR